MKSFLMALPWALFLTRLVLMPVIFTTHELGHALAATLLGDPTPRQEGRLTLNPSRHWEHLGAILLVLIGIGWSRPTHFQPHKMKVNDTLGGVITVLAGPLANIIAILAGLFVMRLFNLTPGVAFISWPDAAEWLTVFVRLNLAVALLNLLPLFPLDAHALISAVLPLPALARWQVLAGRTTLVFGIVIAAVLAMPTPLYQMVYLPVVRAANAALLGW